jgi:hypothetical protein
MDREHYWLLANALAAVPNGDVKYDTILKLCELLKRDNPKFNPDLFLDAAGA